MSTVDLLTFSMRTETPKAGTDWFRIENAKKSGDPTKVYIYDEIGFWGTSAKDFAALLDEIDTNKIEVHFNSPGGSVFDGLAIHASIKNHKAQVTGIVDGLAASAASFILQACDVRQSTRNAQIMIHDAKAYAGGNAQQMRQAAETLDRLSDNIADIYAVRSGVKSAEEFRDMMKAGDKWYSGNEAKDDGLVDEVLDNPEEEEGEEENSWDKDDVQAFVSLPAAQLAQDAKRSVITNRVEEAHMTGKDPQNQNTPPTPPTPPAPAPANQQQAPEAPSPASGVTLVVNGVESTDMNAVQAHITALETFRKETIEGNRKAFVAQLAKDKKILSTAETIAQTETFALSLSDEQFRNWKASMESAPAQSLLGRHGVEPGEAHAPSNGGESDSSARMEVLEEIIAGHKAAGLTDEEIATKASYKELQQLKQASAS